MNYKSVQKCLVIMLMAIGLGSGGVQASAHEVDLSTQDGVNSSVRILDLYIQNLEKKSNVAPLAEIFSVVSVQHLQELVAARLASSFNVENAGRIGIGKVKTKGTPQKASAIIENSGEAFEAYQNLNRYLSTLLGAVSVYGEISSIFYKKYYRDLALVLTKTVKTFIQTKIESKNQVKQMLDEALGVSSAKANEKAAELVERLEKLGGFFKQTDSESLAMLTTNVGQASQKESEKQLPGVANIKAYATAVNNNQVPYNKNFALSLYAYLSYAGGVKKDQQALLCMQACADMFDTQALLDLFARGDINGQYQAILNASSALSESAKLAAEKLLALLQQNKICEWFYSFNDASAIFNLQLDDAVYQFVTDAGKATYAFGVTVRGFLKAARTAGKKYNQVIETLQIATDQDGFSRLAHSRARASDSGSVVDGREVESKAASADGLDLDSDDLDIHIDTDALVQSRNKQQQQNKSAALIQAQVRRKQAAKKVENLKKQKAAAGALAQAQAEEQAAQKALAEIEAAEAEAAKEAAEQFDDGNPVFAAPRVRKPADDELSNLADFQVDDSSGGLESFLNDGEEAAQDKGKGSKKAQKKPTQEQLDAMQQAARQKKAAQKNKSGKSKRSTQELLEASKQNAKRTDELPEVKESLDSILEETEEQIAEETGASIAQKDPVQLEQEIAQAREAVSQANTALQKDSNNKQLKNRAGSARKKLRELLALKEQQFGLGSKVGVLKPSGDEQAVIPGKQDQAGKGAGSSGANGDSSSDAGSVHSASESGSDHEDVGSDGQLSPARPRAQGSVRESKTVQIKEPEKFVVNGNLALLYKAGYFNGQSLSSLPEETKQYVDAYFSTHTKQQSDKPWQLQKQFKAALQEVGSN